VSIATQEPVRRARSRLDAPPRDASTLDASTLDAPTLEAHGDPAALMDACDPLARYRDQFVIADPDVIYLDGNSLGRLPLSTRQRLHEVVEEWGQRLILGWDAWIELGQQTGDVLASVVGASPGEVVLSDSTSVNLYKLGAAALRARPGRRVIVTDDENFPSDLYVLAELAAAHGGSVRTIHADPSTGVHVDDVRRALSSDVALVSLSHVAYRSGALADLPAITSAAHEVGALVLWDLCHSAGAVPIRLGWAGVDLAVGCTYKYLNAGPGGPAFLYVRRDLHTQLRQPICGWFGQADQFAMGADYQPVPDIRRFLVGTPPVLGSVAALEGAKLTAAAGVDAIAAKGRALGTYAIGLADRWLAPLGFTVASPRRETRRGCHVTLRHPLAWQISQAARAAGVIPDFRAPDRLRLGLAALYTRFTDVYEAMQRLRDIVASERHLSFPAARHGIT
jgi:kynureninase